MELLNEATRQRSRTEPGNQTTPALCPIREETKGTRHCVRPSTKRLFSEKITSLGISEGSVDGIDHRPGANQTPHKVKRR